ncbi:EAL domain-containing response regulator [Sinimarinibacterium sp. CAU 1509]|uniref:EAL domain-containing response regulator n=1 Tax=Sinimarinibacterium sp. CAU 1509 TaxID=2562283 RepID=UPI0010ACA195|nr:EAL domain-containing response regulator [Sinimarinibacterium sp. CAU 1509]TJY65216.1 EAL domain-containing response regulator [Sinimarinibacterium sp. CAU 1509]
MLTTNADLTALVVDDSPSIRELVSAMLEDLGVGRVMQAEDGVSAFQRIEQSEWPVDLLFCDLAMPGVDGVETMRGLATRRLEAGIVLLSGMDPKLMATVADMAEQLGLRVLGTISKPFRQPQIAAMIERFRRARAIPSRRPALMITREELDEALHSDRIDVYYQPKIRLSDRVVTGVEALARMHHPAYGVIEPDAFIPLAEESPQRITKLTLSVLERAISQAGIWHRSGLDLGMAINMSTLAIRRLDLPDIVEEMAQRAGVANDRITLELTESQVMGSAEILHIVSRFRLRGFKLSIDDYGTGHSSLKRLKRLPFTELKIDRSFVNGASSDEDMRSILETSVDLGRRLRMDVVAEGVEAWVDWHLLEDMGCDVAQGYVAARPVPATGIPLFAQRWAEHLRH